MGTDPTLFGPVARRSGPTEAAIARTLTAWRRDGHLTGDDAAAYRRVLRALAQRADRADLDADRGDASQLSAARVHGMVLDALRLLAPGTAPAVADAYDDALRRLLDDTGATVPDS